MRKRKLLADYPELLAEWHPTKNEGLTPEDFGAKSRRRIWWLGTCGHEWEAVISDRTRGTTCPYCANKKVWKGFNDLESQFPEIAEEFHSEKNEGLTPDQILAGSTKKVWWQCKFGHEWPTSPLNRTLKTVQHNCPYCANKKVWPGFNDLATTHPLLSKEWHPTKNKELTPQQVSFGSERSVWWQGICGHEWPTKVVNRAKYGSDCPFCTGRKVLAGFNDLATTHPEIAKQWHPTLNDALTPQQISRGSDKQVWWQCGKDHVWKTRVCTRTDTKKRKGSGCPVCVKELKQLGVV